MIEINKKEDILIPFDRIGEQGWDVNVSAILLSISELWGAGKLPDPIEMQQIIELENRLGTSLPQGLKLLYQTFGIANIGEELMSFSDMGLLNDIWKDVPQYGPEFTDEDKIYLPHLITFSDYLGNGNMFCFHKDTKEIYYYDHDSRPYIIKLFTTVDDYIKGCLIFAQSDLFGDDVEQEDVEKWTEEIVMDLFGEETVYKWRY